MVHSQTHLRYCVFRVQLGAVLLLLISSGIRVNCFEIIDYDNYKPDNVPCGGFGVKPLDSLENLEDLEVEAIFPGGKFLSLDRVDGLKWSEIKLQLNTWMISPNTTLVKPGHVLRICRKISACLTVYPGETALHFWKDENEDWDDLFMSNVLYATCYKWDPKTEEIPCKEVKLPQDECFRVFREIKCKSEQEPFVPIFRNSLAFHPDFVSEEFYSYVFNPTCNVELKSVPTKNDGGLKSWNYSLSAISKAQNGLNWYDGVSTIYSDVNHNHNEFITLFQEKLSQTSNKSTASITCQCLSDSLPTSTTEDDSTTTERPNTLSRSLIITLSVLLPLFALAISGYILYRMNCPKNEISLEFLDRPLLPDVLQIHRRNIAFSPKDVMGEGEFGIVYKGRLKTAQNTDSYGKWLIKRMFHILFGCLIKVYERILGPMKSENNGYYEVAIKTMKKPYTTHTINSLLNEIKVMHFIGNHPNVISLIGYCTANLRKGEIFGIVQICQNGCLKQYLQKMHQERSLTSDRCVILNPQELTEENISSSQHYVQTVMLQESQHSGLDTNSFRLLLKWAKEIASGMAYLGKKKVVHIDLAARNVLLDDFLNAKVADFGLSRKLYKFSKYTKQGDDVVPWKWMSLESLSQNIFTVKTDVWSYGVTLWEMFNLGVSEPYPLFKTLNQLITALHIGEKLPYPTYANNEIFHAISKCWDLDAERRPDFSYFEDLFENMINRIPSSTTQRLTD